MLASAHDTNGSPAAADRAHAVVWRNRGLLIVGLWMLAVWAYPSTTWSIVNTWIESETYSHGFLIIPISLWLVFERKKENFLSPPVISITAIFAIGFFSAVWFAGSLSNVQIVQQFAFVATLISLTWFAIGTAAAKRLSFPLAYLLFAVPFGEVFVGPMMDLTATQTVELIRLTGIPVYREGLYFSLPSGNWSVVKACSGVRYLIASVALGTVYAYLTYRSTLRRMLFIFAAVLVPIIANVLRAYMIVMLGHLSDMKLATGVDHLIYGWVFFGLVMFLLFWVGSWFAESESMNSDSEALSSVRLQSSKQSVASGGLLAASIAVLSATALLFLFPTLNKIIEQRGSSAEVVEIEIKPLGGELHSVDSAPWSWRPPFYGADSEVHQYFEVGEQLFGVSIGIYVDQQQGSEMISYHNGWIHRKNDDWKKLKQWRVSIDNDTTTLDVDAANIAGEGYELAVYTWFDIDGFEHSNKYAAKLKEVIDKVSFADSYSARILVYTPSPNSVKAEAMSLNEFVVLVRPQIREGLRAVTAEASR